jgi:hypothetical protein
MVYVRAALQEQTGPLTEYRYARCNSPHYPQLRMLPREMQAPDHPVERLLRISVLVRGGDNIR